MRSLDLNKVNTSKTTHMTGLFANMTNAPILKINKMDFSSCKYFSNLFSNSKFEMIDLRGLNFSTAVDLSYMFSASYGVSSNLKEIIIDSFDTPLLENINSMFQGCENLVSIPKIDCSSVDDPRIFSDKGGYPSVKNIGGFINLGKGFPSNMTSGSAFYILDMHLCTNLTHEALMNVINNLYDIKTAIKKTSVFKIGDTNKAKLTETEIKIATDKGWAIS